MLHWFAVGHFDPTDPVDRSEKPYRPKPLRPVPREAVERAVAEFGRGIGPSVDHDEDGVVYCDHSPAGEEFAVFLAESLRAVVMDERHLIWWPEDARRRQEQAFGWAPAPRPTLVIGPGRAPPDAAPGG